MTLHRSHRRYTFLPANTEQTVARVAGSTSAWPVGSAGTEAGLKRPRRWASVGGRQRVQCRRDTARCGREVSGGRGRRDEVIQSPSPPRRRRRQRSQATLRRRAAGWRPESLPLPWSTAVLR